MTDGVRATHRSEIYQLKTSRPHHAEETETMLRANAVPELAQVDVEGIEVTLAAPDPFGAADTSVPYKDKVEASIEGISQQLPKEKFCQILFEVLKPDTEANQKPERLIEAMHWLVRSGQGGIEFKDMATKPEDRCAQYLSEDRSIVLYEFVDMDASAYPSLIHAQNIGRLAVCKKDWKAGSTQQRSADEGYTVPNIQAGQNMIIAQVPACNPKAR